MGSIGEQCLWELLVGAFEGYVAGECLCGFERVCLLVVLVGEALREVAAR